MQAKRLRPADREQRDEAKGEMLKTKGSHAGGKIVPTDGKMQVRIHGTAA